MRTMKYKSHVMFVLYPAINHLRGPLRKQNFLKWFKKSWFVIFCDSRFIACDRNNYYNWWQLKTQLWKQLFVSRVCVFAKSTVKWNGYEAYYTFLLHVFICFFGLDSVQRLMIASLSLWYCKQIKTSHQFFSFTIIFCEQNRSCAHHQGATNITCSTLVFIFDESGLS